MGRGGLRLGKAEYHAVVPPTRARKPRAKDKVDRLIQEGLRRASHLADDAVGTRASKRGAGKLWRPYDPGNKKVVSTHDARRALRSVGVDVSLEELKSVTGEGMVRYDRFRQAPSPEKRVRGRTLQRRGSKNAGDAESRLVSRMASASEVAPLRVALRRQDIHRSGHLAPRDFVRAIQAHYGAETLEADEAAALCAAYNPHASARVAQNDSEDSDAMKATLQHGERQDDERGRTTSTHFEATHPAVDYERFLEEVERKADSQAPPLHRITPVPPAHPPPREAPPYARPDDHSALSLREPLSPCEDLIETAAGRRAVREVSRVLDNETVRERWLCDEKGGQASACGASLRSCGARLTAAEAEAVTQLGVSDGSFCGRRLARRCLAAANNEPAPPGRTERHERLALERAAQAVARASGCLDEQARRSMTERIARGCGTLPVPSHEQVAVALKKHHVLSEKDADALALAASRRAQTVPLAEALHAVLFRGRDANVTEMDPKPPSQKADLPVACNDHEPTTIVSLARAPAPQLFIVQPEHRAAEANITAALERLANAPCPTFFSRTEPNVRVIRRGVGSCRQRDSVIWCLDAPSLDTCVEPLYPAGLDVPGQVRFAHGNARKRRSRSRSEPPASRFSTTYGDMAPPVARAPVPPPPPPPPSGRPPRPPARRRSQSCAPPQPIGVVLGLC